MESASFGEWIRRRRRSLDLTREALAQQVGCAVVTIRKIESDERRPSRQIAERLAECLQIPHEERPPFLRAARAGLLVDRLPLPPAPALAAPPTRPAAPAAGRKLRGYLLHDQIGAGGFGVVFRAAQPGVGREVAIKSVHPQYADNPEFIRRFEAEAHFVARLEHPHIVPLYDYWRDQAGAFLVMRYMRGGSLQQALLAGRLAADRVTQLLDQIGAALALAHGHGVIHRDVKPANVLFDEQGNAYLSDFGIAKDLLALDRAGATRPGALGGSPAYLAPEDLRGDPPTIRSDVYSLGVLLYEALAGAHLFGVGAAQRLRQLNQPLPSLTAGCPDLPVTLDTVIDRATAPDPDDRYPDVPALLVDWHRAFARAVAPHMHDEPVIAGAAPLLAGAPVRRAPAPAAPAPRENPYKGLRAFGAADAADFFGREALTQQLIERMSEETREARFLAVVGPSGSGKSSVVRAGLIPALRRGALPGSERWFIVEVMPGAHPLEEIEAGLLRIAVNPPEHLLGQLRDDRRGLARVVKRVLPADPETELVLVIDQFEELFTLTRDEAARAHLLECLLAALDDPRGRLRLVITLRADFYDRPLLHPDFGKLVRQRTEVVLPMSAEELERAIVAPAARVGVGVEAGLVAAIVQDVAAQPGALPLLEYALTELFERCAGTRDGVAARLALVDYRAGGGVMGALARRADELYARLDDRGRIAARQLFLRLVAPGEGVEDTRRRVRLSELASGPIAADDRFGAAGGSSAALDLYGAARLLTFDRDPVTREPTVEIAHEALIRAWDRLRGWLDTGREQVRVQRRLARAAADWLAAGRDPSFLAWGAQLAQYAVLAEAGDLALNHDEQSFLDLSSAAAEREAAEREAQRQRELEAARWLAEAEQQRAAEQARANRQLRQLAVALSVVLLVALASAGLALVQRGRAEQAARTAQSRELAAAALANLDADQERSVLLALAARAAADTPEAEDALRRSILASRLRLALPGKPGTSLQGAGVAASPDGKRLLVSSLNSDGTGSTAILDAGSGAALATMPGYWGGSSWPKDDRLLTVYPRSDSIVLTIWNAADSRVRPISAITVPFQADNISSLVLSPDYGYVVAATTDGQLLGFRASSRRSQFRVDGDYGPIAFSSDGTRLAAGKANGIIYVWDVRDLASGDPSNLPSSTSALVLAGHTEAVAALDFSPDGSRLVSAADDGTVRIWNTADLPRGASGILRPPAASRLLHTLRGHTNDILCVVFSPDGKYVASAGRDRTIRLWDAASGAELFALAGHADAVDSISFSADGTRLFSASLDGAVRGWDLMPAHELGTIVVAPAGTTNSWLAMSLNPDGTQLATTSAAQPSSARVWDVATGRERLNLQGYADSVSDIAFSPDGKRIAASNGDGTVRVWDSASGKELLTLAAGAPIRFIAFSPDGKRIATGNDDHTVAILDTATGKRLQSFTAGNLAINRVAFSPDGRRLAAVSADAATNAGIVTLWDSSSGAWLLSLRGHTSVVFGVAFSPDGARLATASRDGTARVWDAASGKPLLTLAGHTSTVFDVAWSRDGKRIATAGSDGMAKVWDAASGDQIVTLYGATMATSAVAFSPDGARLYVASVDGVVRVYTLREEELVALGRSRVTRGLTAEECRRYLHVAECSAAAP